MKAAQPHMWRRKRQLLDIGSPPAAIAPASPCRTWTQRKSDFRKASVK